MLPRLLPKGGVTFICTTTLPPDGGTGGDGGGGGGGGNYAGAGWGGRPHPAPYLDIGNAPNIGSGRGDTLSKLLGQDPRLRVCIGQANQNFNTQTQNAGINTNVSPETRNFDLKTAFGLNSGMGKFATTFAVLAGLLRGGVKGGTLGALTTPAGRSIYALSQALDPAQYARDIFQANKDYNQQVADCHQSYGN